MAKYCRDVDEFLSWHGVQPGPALVVGANTYGAKQPRQRLYEDATGIDIVAGEGVDVVHNLERPIDRVFSHVDCCSVLEHCQRPWLMAQNIEASLVEGGTLLVSAPFAWRLHDYPGDYWRFTVDAYKILFPSIRWVNAGYLVGNRLKKLPPRMEMEGAKGVERAEALAFGYKCSASS